MNPLRPRFAPISTALVVVGTLAFLIAPLGSADPGTNPHTCFANAQAPAIQVHVACDEPRSNPCLVKAQAVGRHANVCDKA